MFPYNFVFCIQIDAQVTHLRNVIFSSLNCGLHVRSCFNKESSSKKYQLLAIVTLVQKPFWGRFSACLPYVIFKGHFEM